MLKICYTQGVVEAGCDEAGRGPLAGSVFCAAVCWDSDWLQAEASSPELAMLNDSKQLTEKQRDELRPWIENHARAWAVVEVTAEEIDRINILQASLTGMRRALDAVQRQLAGDNCSMHDGDSRGIEHVIVDGNKWRPWVPEGEIMAVPADTVVKGDGKYMSIAAASVLAKTHRDEYMRRLAQEFPQYGWERNMGYPTKEHYEAIEKYGITPYHRKTFKLKKI